MKKLITYLYFLLLITDLSAETFISEDFKTMDMWEALIFGSDPPQTASLAIMGDSDNTGESSTAFIDFILLESE